MRPVPDRKILYKLYVSSCPTQSEYFLTEKLLQNFACIVTDKQNDFLYSASATTTILVIQSGP